MLARAAELFQGDFLNGFNLRDSAAFEEWQFFQTERLRRAAAGALEHLVRIVGEARRFEEAIGHARRWLALDPLQEAPQRALMRLYARRQAR